jgi:hypothetical protein
VTGIACYVFHWLFINIDALLRFFFVFYGIKLFVFFDFVTNLRRKIVFEDTKQKRLLDKQSERRFSYVQLSQYTYVILIELWPTANISSMKSPLRPYTDVFGAIQMDLISLSNNDLV